MAKKNVLYFEDAFVDKFINEKMKQYDLPKQEVEKMIWDCFSFEKYDLLNTDDREYVESYIAVQAVYYHNGRK